MSSRMQASVSNKILAVFAELRYYNRARLLESITHGRSHSVDSGCCRT